MYNYRNLSIDPIGRWLFKWIGVPFLVGVALMYAYNWASMQRKCQKLAEKRGYLEASYIPSYRGLGAKCVLRGRVLADGTVDEDAELTIRLD